MKRTKQHSHHVRLLTNQVYEHKSFFTPVKMPSTWTYIDQKLTSPSQCYEFIKQILFSYWEKFHEIESFYAIYLNQGNRVMCFNRISIGGVNSTVADPRVIYSNALEIPKVTSIILCHNHPSGQATPSESDVNLTEKLKKAGQVLDINLLDHIIVAPQHDGGCKFYSFAEEGKL